jgi:hypothetical protein
VVAFALTVVKRFPIWTAIGVFALVGYLFRDFLSGSVSDLKVGDCVDLPTPITTATINDVQHHPCTELHHGEAFFVGNVPSGASGANPGVAAFDSFVTAQCVPAFRVYTGLDYETDPTYDIEFLHPTPEGWRKGDRTIHCLVIRIDEQAFRGTLRVGR